MTQWNMQKNTHKQQKWHMHPPTQREHHKNRWIIAKVLQSTTGDTKQPTLSGWFAVILCFCHCMRFGPLSDELETFYTFVYGGPCFDNLSMIIKKKKRKKTLSIHWAIP